MLSNEYATPLNLDFHPSWLAASILIFIHLGALVIVFLIPAPVFFKIALCVLILANLLSAYNRVLLKNSDSIKRIIWNEDNNWLLIRNDETKITTQLLPSTYVHAWMTVLNFNAAGFRSCSMVLLPGVIDSNEFRRLRVRLTLTQHSLTE